MRIAVLGGGPAGLYFAILMKKADPSHAITVIERNAADATFGWGVVFSEETLGALRDADYRSFLDITDSFARWNTIDIRYHGRLIRSRGHVFSGISRKLLLSILQRRAAELDVELRFQTEVPDPAQLADADLLVAADGANSTVRAQHADVLGARATPVGAKYVWFGTDLVFDAFTFIFRDTEHGLFQVHAYPFDARTSTFIVECPESTWRAAGLDHMSEEESIRFCEELFAEELDGHRLLSNRSLWLSFLKVSAESWYHENTVLLGDAAHTAHFTIGSGTKLAMEDAIALTNAMVRHSELERALVDYELERQPVVERFQEAADQSADYFQHVRSYLALDPIQFAFNLITRSGRISYANLVIRDPQLVRRLDSWFACTASGGGANGGIRIAPPPMFAPLTVAATTLRNRVVQCPPGEDAEDGGCPAPRDVERLVAAAETGPALVLTTLVAVSADGRITPRTPTIEAEAQADAWQRVVEAVHEAGAMLGIQLGHAGRRGSTRPRREGADLPLHEGGWPLLSASPLPYTPGSATPREMDADDMSRVREQHVTAAERALAAGFDALELNFAQGYLVASFISPLTNRREDEFGGSLENRLRFPLEVLEAVRSIWPPERPLIVRIAASDWSSRGLPLEEAIDTARALRSHGCDVVHVSAGQTVAEDRAEYRRGFVTRLGDRIRAEAGVPTMVAGYVTTEDEVNTIVGAGRADLCLLDAGAFDREAVAA
jgi:anthraniloyl-CoA monooxygenase